MHIVIDTNLSNSGQVISILVADEFSEYVLEARI